MAPPPSMSEIDREAKREYFFIHDNVSAIKRDLTPEEYQGARKLADILCKKIIKINSLDDMPELPD